jgi:glycosyltransferase involved in cell wall biosynthesis
MPARNSADTIDRAISTTLRAMPADAELVVLDDASSDATADVLASVSDRRLRVERSEVRLGVAGALDRLLAITDSVFVARMDADDETLPGRFRLQMLAAGGSDAVFSTVLARSAGRIRPAGSFASIGHREFPFRLLLGNPVAHSTLLARRDAINRAGGYRDVPAEDYDLWLRMAVVGARLRRLAVPTVVYSHHAGQQTGEPGWHLSSWHDARTNQSFEDLSRALLGRPYARHTTLAVSADEAEFEAELQRFSWSFATVVGARFRPRAATALNTRLRKRVRVIRSLRGADHVAL